MTDILANAVNLAKQIGEQLASQGSTSDMKTIGSNIVSTASKLGEQIQNRRSTRRNTPVKPTLPVKHTLPAGLTAMNVLIAQKKAEATKSMANIAAKPLMSLRKGILTSLPNITGGARRRTHRRR
jgi:hypothetical protein